MTYSERACINCDSTGKWTNPNNTADKRECFYCKGTGRRTSGAAPAWVGTPRKRRAAPPAVAGDFLDGLEGGESVVADEAPDEQDKYGALPSATPAAAPTAVDTAALVRDITAKLVPIVRGEINDATGRTERTLRAEIGATIDSEISAIARNLELSLFDRLNKRLPLRIELSRNGVVLPEVTGHQHPAFAKLLRMCTSRNADGYAPNVWITGPAGSGKTTGARMVAEALGVPFFVNGALETKFEATGYKDAAGHYHSTEFREAFGQPSVYLFDDIDGCDSNGPVLALNSALANNLMAFPDEKVKRHPDCVIIATANTWGLGATADYVGRIRFDAAFLDRFGGRLQWGYDEEFEVAISGHAEWAQRVQRARAKAAQAGLKVLISPRATIAGAAYLAAGFEVDEVAEMTYLAGLTAEQRRMIQ